ncbi:MAG: TonB-dependent receptor plug domain-containing protein, partial [Phascolarctobacterium succinatutens]
MKKLASKGLLMSALICGNVLWGGTTVLANEVQEYELDEMVVTATRTMKQIQEVPSSVSVVTAKDIEERNITSVPEALQTLPGVYKSQAIQG